MKKKKSLFNNQKKDTDYFLKVFYTDGNHNKSLYSQSYGFSSSNVCMWELDRKEDWAPKNWHFWILVQENSWESLGQQRDQTSQS